MTRLTLLALLLSCLLIGPLTISHAQSTQPVKLRFAAAVNGSPFECGKNYPNIGTRKSTITPTDFRLFVSEVALLRADGKAVPVTLAQDGVWQYQNIALLDFENGSGPCSNGTQATNTEISGTVPSGKYTGVRFTLGVPFALNHGDPTIAPSPLNITAMFWNWQGGYKFLKVDITTKNAAPMGHHNRGAHGSHGDHNGGEASGFPVHIGSTACASPSPTQKPSECKNPNRLSVTFENFDPSRHTIVADLGALLAGADVERNTPNTPPGCMSFPKDPDCSSVMRALSLSYDGARADETQRFFRVR